VKTNTFNATVICLCCGLLFCQLTACSTFYPDTSIPAYISVDSVPFSCNYLNYGSSSANITDLWAYSNNNPAGVYDVPALFPLLNQGSTLMQFSAGIIENGISNTRAIYPFYTYDTVTVNIQPNHTTSIIPRFTYRSGTIMALKEDFENGNAFKSYQSSAVMARVSGPNVFEGGYSGYINLTTDTSNYQGITSSSWELPTQTAVYLELNYMCNIPFNIGLRGIVSAGDTLTPINYFLGVNPVNIWNKMYVNLTPYIAEANASGAVTYQIAIDAELPAGSTSGQVYLDNIKLVHF